MSFRYVMDGKDAPHWRIPKNSTIHVKIKFRSNHNLADSFIRLERWEKIVDMEPPVALTTDPSNQKVNDQKHTDIKVPPLISTTDNKTIQAQKTTESDQKHLESQKPITVVAKTIAKIEPSLEPLVTIPLKTSMLQLSEM